jgi:uroporphyrinogen decarboxylase
VAQAVKLPWVYHSDGDLSLLMDDLLSLGMSGLNPIEPEAMDIEKVKAQYGSRVCLMGNVDVGMLTDGTCHQVEERVQWLIRTIGKGGGYILASGNSIPDYCKVENVLAMRNAVIKYRDYK